MKSKKSMAQAKLKERESGFDLNSIPHAKLPEYNALHDPNMRHYFENSNIQRLLYSSGQIDKYGRVINLEKTKAKLHILEREFKEAERMEEIRQKEEMEMRVCTCHSLIIYFTEILTIASSSKEAIHGIRENKKKRNS